MSILPTREDKVRHEEFSKFLNYINSICGRSVLRDSRCIREPNHTGNHKDSNGWEVCIHGFEPLFRPEHLKESPDCDWSWKSAEQMGAQAVQAIEPLEDGDPRYW